MTTDSGQAKGDHPARTQAKVRQRKSVGGGGSYTELKHICTYMYIFICIFRRRSNRSPVPSCLQFGTFGRDPNSRDLFQLLQLLQTAVRVASVSLCSYTAKKNVQTCSRFLDECTSTNDLYTIVPKAIFLCTSCACLVIVNT